MSEAATARKPKLAELFLQAHERKPQPLSGSHAHFVESQFEVEDASSCEFTGSPVMSTLHASLRAYLLTSSVCIADTGALLAFEGIIDRLHHPSRYEAGPCCGGIAHSGR